jgi:hypothetical protein
MQQLSDIIVTHKLKIDRINVRGTGQKKTKMNTVTDRAACI